MTMQELVTTQELVKFRTNIMIRLDRPKARKHNTWRKLLESLTWNQFQKVMRTKKYIEVTKQIIKISKSKKVHKLASEFLLQHNEYTILNAKYNQVTEVLEQRGYWKSA